MFNAIRGVAKITRAATAGTNLAGNIAMSTMIAADKRVVETSRNIIQRV